MSADHAHLRAEEPVEHAVHFYDDDESLVRVVASFAATSLRAGGAMLAIATASYRRGVEAALEDQGFDVERLAAEGRLAAADAEEVVSAFMVGDVPDPVRFRRTVEPLVARARAACGPGQLRVFGEMVNVLWRRGNAAAAIRLEELWTELVAERPLSLLCAYRLDGFARHEHGAAFRDVCARHGSVVPTTRYLDLEADEKLRYVADLEQRARALGAEVERRRLLEEERERLLDAERVARAELERAAVERERLLGIVSHDLRNPLSAITMSATALLRRQGRGDGAVKPLERIVASAKRMERLIGQLLEFAQARNAGIPVHPTAVDVAQIAWNVLDELQAAHPDRRLVLETDGDTTGSWDPDLLGEVLSNLAGNALQHGGRGPVTVRIRGTDGAVLAEIHDDGGVIPPDLLPHLFEPFRRARSDGWRSQGVGLGLFITREIVRAHRGTIEVRSSPSRGTTVAVRLPRR